MQIFATSDFAAAFCEVKMQEIESNDSGTSTYMPPEQLLALALSCLWD